MNTEDFDAVIFDLDGVVTDTAKLHAKAWKRMFDEFLSEYYSGRNETLKPFDIESDYILYVDGKPRRDGIRSFLASRNVDLPEGQTDDAPGIGSVAAMARLKNNYFLKLIEEQGAEVFQSTVELIHAVKTNGCATAIISSSRNCAMILESVGLSDLFDTRVDGNDAETLGFPGKPAPDIFLEAADRLNVRVERAVVVEDAIAGVQAAKAGGFGLVIGVSRSGDMESLLNNGADIAVGDLCEIEVHTGNSADNIRGSALDRIDEIAEQIRGKRLAVFLDYDGTLSPIVDTPEMAIMSESMRKAVVELSRHCTVGIISGRDLADVQNMVNIDSIVFAGSHGFDISGPEGLNIEIQTGTEFLPVLDEAEKEVSEQLRSIEGMLVERKKFAIAIHFRLVDPAEERRIEKVVDDVVSHHPELRKAYGKKIFELQPDIDWHKGKALLALLKELGLDGDDVVTMYLGDDVTDEDAFEVLKDTGIGIIVRDEQGDTAASYSLEDTDEVRDFLLKLVQLCSGGTHE